ncbi:hypothetical protein L9F63_006963 [Diploptera punctata]|uniref:Uncharacterized protein n=1 Tax=Diploptera punctata TaxID=6984 RepID=A0AAD7Z910_DIPPU|nr:hypothetical protein L9F63_006963 [Diploptera punctata]
MKATAVILLLSVLSTSQMVHCFEMSTIIEIGKAGYDIMMTCAQNNNLSIGQLMSAFSNPAKSLKCTAACIMDNFSMMDSDGNVDVDFMDNVSRAIVPSERIQNVIQEILKNCKTAGKGSNKCDNSYNFIKCCSKNLIPALMTLFRG